MENLKKQDTLELYQQTQTRKQILGNSNEIQESQSLIKTGSLEAAKIEDNIRKGKVRETYKAVRHFFGERRNRGRKVMDEN